MKRNGNIKLEDLGEHYWNGDKDKFYMDFESVPEELKESWR